MSPGQGTNPLVDRLRLLTSLDASILAAVAAACVEVQQAAANTDLIRQGDRPERLHVMLGGWACRTKLLADGRRQIPALLLPGDICNLDALHVRRLDYGVSTLTPCRVAVVDRAALLDLIDQHPQVGRVLTWLGFVENATLSEWNLCLGQRSAREHMAHLFCELLVRMTMVDQAEGNSCAMPLTQPELGDVLGLTSVHVNRTLQDLRADGLVTLKVQQLTIRNWDVLKAEGGFRTGYLHMQGMRN